MVLLLVWWVLVKEEWCEGRRGCNVPFPQLASLSSIDVNCAAALKPEIG